MTYTESTIKLNEERKLRVLARREAARIVTETKVRERWEFNDWLKVALANATQEQD